MNKGYMNDARRAELVAKYKKEGDIHNWVYLNFEYRACVHCYLEQELRSGKWVSLCEATL